jgi:hypothetical protein
MNGRAGGVLRVGVCVCVGWIHDMLSDEGGSTPPTKTNVTMIDALDWAACFFLHIFLARRTIGVNVPASHWVVGTYWLRGRWILAGDDLRQRSFSLPMEGM